MNICTLHTNDYYPFGMPMPGRSYRWAWLKGPNYSTDPTDVIYSTVNDLQDHATIAAENIGYSYGFQGQEQDDEVKGKGNSLVFKYRIHDPRLGRFLSIDPLAKHFGWSSSYSFAMNRVIDGIDLEGLEYLESDKARIKIVGGQTHINLQNFNSVTRYLWNKRDNESSIPGYIGWPTQIGELSHPYLPSSQLVTLDNTYLVADPSKNPFLIQKQGLRNDGQIDNRVKKPVNRPNSSSRVRGVGGFALAFNAINWGLNSYGNSLVKEDVELVTEHTSILMKQVMRDLTDALERGMIPKEYQNMNAIGNIANVVLSGVNLTKDKKIYEIGMTIVREISDKRIKTSVHDDRYSMGITPADATAVDNSIHDYSYGPANGD
ncbi:MAG: RHS repeat-associated core domain-containing protein [Bacteroidia bacterium]